MTTHQIRELMERAKQWPIGNSGYDQIEHLCETLLEAIEILKEVKEITSDVDEQGYQYDWMQHVDSFTFQPVRSFLKKVGANE